MLRLIRYVVALGACTSIACGAGRSEPQPAAFAPVPDAQSPTGDTAPVTDAGTAGRKPNPEKPAIDVRVDRARLKKDVAFVAKPRPPKSPHWVRVQSFAEKRLKEAKLSTERHAYGTGINILGRRTGARADAPQVVVSAHYDHVARCAGADDNASGVAAVLEIARLLEPFEFENSLVVALWDEEELGLLGSRAYAQSARARGDTIVVALSLDAVGYASRAPNSQRVPAGFESVFVEQGAALRARNYAGDFLALLANSESHLAAASFRAHAETVDLPVISAELSLMEALAFPDVFRSDHASFWQHDYPALLLTDSGELRNPGYHCGQRADSPGTLDYEFLERVTLATARTVADLLEVR